MLDKLRLLFFHSENYINYMSVMVHSSDTILQLLVHVKLNYHYNNTGLFLGTNYNQEKFWQTDTMLVSHDVSKLRKSKTRDLWERL